MLSLEIPDLTEESHRGRRRIRRVPAVLREGERSSHNYDPKVISLGPIHHGKPHLHLGQTFKQNSLKIFLSTVDKQKSFFLDKIIADIDEIRGFYDQVLSHEYDDAALSEMMLLDGCFVVSLMEVFNDSERLIDVLQAIGMVGISFAASDMFLVENQIPFRVITLLISLRYDDVRKGKNLINDFLNFYAFNGHFSKPQNDLVLEPPLHLLEAIRRKLVSPCTQSTNTRSKPCILSRLFPCRKSRPKISCKKEVRLRTRLYTSRSVTDLKAKGIGFQPSPSACLKDVRFTSNGIFYGNLQLPPRCVSENSKVLFVNLVAYETCPGNVSDYAVSSYINLMKSLIHSEGDVKELRERRVLISNLGSDEQVFRVLKEIDTYGAENAGIFNNVKEGIEEHYNSKKKTWMAELMHTYFDSPWTAISLLAAVLLLVATFLQTYFTIQ